MGMTDESNVERLWSVLLAHNPDALGQHPQDWESRLAEPQRTGVIGLVIAAVKVLWCAVQCLGSVAT